MTAIRHAISGVPITFIIDAPGLGDWEGTFPRFTSGDYEITFDEHALAPGAIALDWRLRRLDDAKVHLRKLTIDLQLPLVGLYRLWPTSGIAANSVYIDLPWHLDTTCSAATYDPVVMGLNTNGLNTCTVGLATTVIETRISGKMGRSSPDAAAGFTSHVYHLRFERPGPDDVSWIAAEINDGLIISTIEEDWFASLRRYTAHVDERRVFTGHPVRDRALMPMWHSWYAFENQINQENVRSQIPLARDLGFGTFQLDAGWNTGTDWVKDEGCYEPNRERFPDFESVMQEIKDAGMVPVAHWSPPWLGRNAPNRSALADAIQPRAESRHQHVDYLCPRHPATFDHIVSSARHMVADLGFGGLWYDFIDAMPADHVCTSDHEHIFDTAGEAWDAILQATAAAAWTADPDCSLIARRSHANINNKPYLTHLWPMDAPFDFDKNRREVVVLKAYAAGTLTHACCTCWSPLETDAMVARHLASVVLAGVPAISIDLTKFPPSHLAGIKAWLAFYEEHKQDLMLGTMQPLQFMPPSAVVRVESDTTAFVGYFEAMPGITMLSGEHDEVFLINCFEPRLHTLLPTLSGEYTVELFDHFLRPVPRHDVSPIASGDQGLQISMECPSPAVIQLRRHRS